MATKPKSKTKPKTKPAPKAKPKLGVIPTKGRFVRTDDRKDKPS